MSERRDMGGDQVDSKQNSLNVRRRRMAITDIKELRLLPPLAIARFGSSSEPLENYTVEVDPRDRTGFRRLVPAPTLVVKDAGDIEERRPSSKVAFRDAHGQVKPLAPFLELWARFDDGGLWSR